MKQRIISTEDKIDFPILFFDGVCTLCNQSVDFVIRHDKKKKIRFAALQSQTAQNLLKDRIVSLQNPNSLVWYNQGKIKQKSNAVFALVPHLGFPFTLSLILWVIPRFLRNYVYDVIARNRYKWFGKKESCRIPTQEEQQLFLD